MLGGVAEGSREDREKRYGPTQNAAMRCRPETPKTKRCAVARKETMRCRLAGSLMPARRGARPYASPPGKAPTAVELSDVRSARCDRNKAMYCRRHISDVVS